jgi:hypothetical protein
MTCSMLGLLVLLAWFVEMVSLDGEGRLAYIRAYDVPRPSSFTQQFTFV